MGASFSLRLRDKQSTNNNPPRQFCSRAEDWPYVWALMDGSELDWKAGLSDDEIQQIAAEHRDLPCPIISDCVYLGNAQSIHNVEKLEGLGIQNVLNMAGSLAIPSSVCRRMKERGIRYKVISALDEEDYPLLDKHWLEVDGFLSDCARKRQKCVVNCVAGHNRSGLVVAAYYMKTKSVNVLETVKHVRRQRGNVAIQNNYFQEQLVAFARANDLLGPPPGSPGCIVESVPPPDWRSSDLRAKKQNPLDRL